MRRKAYSKKNHPQYVRPDIQKGRKTMTKITNNESDAKPMGMYDPRFEHDSCGIGAVVNVKGIKSHETVVNAL